MEGPPRPIDIRALCVVNYWQRRLSPEPYRWIAISTTCLGLDVGQLFIIDFNTKLLVISSMPSAMDVSAIIFSSRSGSFL